MVIEERVVRGMREHAMRCLALCLYQGMDPGETRHDVAVAFFIDFGRRLEESTIAEGNRNVQPCRCAPGECDC